MSKSARPLVVAVGSSAGGVEAFTEFVKALGETPGFAVAFIQHLDAASKSLLVDLLAASTSLTIKEVTARTKVKLNTIYLAPPGILLTLRKGFLVPEESDDADRHVASIDQFFHSVADDQGERGLGVVLSGAGSDGTLGLKAISDCGGMTFAQDAASAKFDSMPRNAATTGVADHVLPPADIAAELIKYARYLEQSKGLMQTTAHMDTIEQAIPKITEQLLRVTGHNFQHYKISTLGRRIHRRMQILKISQVRRYVEQVQNDPDEAGSLFRELLIGVTAFFRDPDSFEELAKQVIPKLFLRRQSNDPVRIWIPGCATGEEAYTMAILCREHLDTIEGDYAVQIVASDIDVRALDIARKGSYPIGIVDHVSEERLDRFFVKKGKRYHVKKEIRESVLFSPHNLISDPPFSRQDLVSCRNLLIYLGPHLQKKLIPLFHYALRPGGYLFLGPSESMTSHKELFRSVNEKHRISQRKGTAIGKTPQAVSKVPAVGSYHPLGSSSLDDDKTDAVQIMQRIILDEFAPKSVVVDEDGHVICSSGEMNKYLSTGEGAFSNRIVKMARRGLRIGLRAALLEAKAKRRRIVHENLSVETDEGKQPVMITVQPMMRIGEDSGLFLVVFHDVGLPIEGIGNRKDANGASDDESETANVLTSSATDMEVMVEQLERELATARDDLENSMQEMEAANEELKSSNEELLSMNEELQSANEELESSKEEILCSSEAVARANSDLENLLRSTRIATIFLDEDYSIRSFTPAATDLYGLIPTDIGRPLTQLVPYVQEMPALPDASVLDGENPVKHTVLGTNGRTYIRRVLPYQDQSGQSRGIVVTFTDVTDLKESQDRLLANQAELAQAKVKMDLAMEVSGVASWTWDFETNQPFADSNLNRLWGFNADEKPSLEDLVGRIGEEHRERIGSALENVFERGGPYDQEHTVHLPSGKTRWVRAFGRANSPTESPREFAGIVTDITDRKAFELDLKQRESHFRSMTDGLPLMVWTNDELGRHQVVNRAFCEFFGINADETEDLSWRKLLHEADVEIYLSQFARCVAERSNFHAEVRARRADGQWRWIESWGQPRFSSTGDYIGHIGASADVTDRVEAVRDLAENRRRLALAMNAARMGSFVWDRISNELIWDEEWMRAVGLQQEIAHTGDAFFDRVHPEDLAELHRNIARSRDSGSDFKAEFRIIRDDGELRWLAGVGNWILDGVPKGEKPCKLAGLNWDITEQKEYENEIRLNEERLRVAAGAAGFGMFHVDIDNNHVDWSDEFCRLVGIDPNSNLDMAIGDMPDFVHPADAEKVRISVQKILDDLEEPDHWFNHRILKKSGEVRHVRVQTRSLYEGEGDNKRMKMLVGTLLDVTQQKEYETKLRKQKRIAEIANASKSEFVANMSHEIRTPMTAILGYADLLQDHIHSEEARDHLSTIRRNGDYLLEIINDILDLSKIEAGKLDIDLERFRPEQIIEDVRSIMEVRAKERGLELEVRYEGQIPRIIESDGKRLKQILINLVGNALKFTHDGRVEMVISMRDDKLGIDVIDSGIGMSSEQQDRLFQPFTQADSLITQQFGGTGLGLAISQRLAAMLGGAISCESKLGCGSKFTVTFSTGNFPGMEMIQPGSLAETSPSSALNGESVVLDCEILIVDDRRDIRFLSKQILSKAGAKITEAEDGLLGIQAVKKRMANGSNFDLILLDMQMPNLDGYETAKQLRQMGFLSPIIALTADAMQGDMNRCIQSGCNDYLSKPIDKGAMLQMVSRFLFD
ncbi:Autoinducer 2 sensor kinase/phosphatase LuxQ [Rubripirellula amarantea]|uniref:histidine kinase n=1 Tax=Rubripirellula amarantea TaxID=2527999 RepID=A0A5C5WVA2_9BACT|nr:CheR family methyltransferase [Rubripirellula amarantea]TWT54884.1 Autoinducer 2 sensor kinase/phosphatase LuxQ [Rubripirellula amarantea]